MTDREYVRLLYITLLGRTADEPGLEHHVKLIASHGGDLRVALDSIVQSEEYRNRTETPEQSISFVGLSSRPITIVDVGAQNIFGVDHIYSPLLKSGLPCHCIGFEPLEERRTERAADHDIELFPDCVGDGSAQTLHINNDDATSSLLPLNIDFNAAFNHLRELRTVETKSVSTTRLDDVLGHLPAIDFLKLDIQGFELPALHGASQLLAKTNVIHCEVEFAQIYQGQALFSEVEAYLRDRGFAFIDFVTLGRYVYASVPEPTHRQERLCWADAIFFRELPQTGGNRDDAVAQAATAAYVYGKTGLAKKILMDNGLLRD